LFRVLLDPITTTEDDLPSNDVMKVIIAVEQRAKDITANDVINSFKMRSENWLDLARCFTQRFPLMELDSLMNSVRSGEPLCEQAVRLKSGAPE
jgi:hypothetical protein